MTAAAASARGLAALALLWWLAATAAAWAQAPVPPLTGRVVDTTGTLSAETRQRLDRRLAGLETETGAQVAVLMVATTDGEAIEPYAVRVFEAWKLGRQGIDDGVLLVVARDDRALRIEVGYGLEGAVTDVQAGRLIREYIAPHFAAGDFAGGVEAGVDGLAVLIRQEPLPPPQPMAADEDGAGWYGLLVLAFIALFTHPIVLVVAGGVLGAMFLPGLGGFLGAVVGALAGGVIGVLLTVTGARRVMRRAMRNGRSGPGGGWGGGRGGGGGGFGGGGGRSGGGGASGRW